MELIQYHAHLCCHFGGEDSTNEFFRTVAVTDGHKDAACFPLPDCIDDADSFQFDTISVDDVFHTYLLLVLLSLLIQMVCLLTTLRDCW